MKIEQSTLSRIIIQNKATQIYTLQREIEASVSRTFKNFSGAYHYVVPVYDCHLSPCGVCVFAKENKTCLFCERCLYGERKN
jgi:hypothetical protein